MLIDSHCHLQNLKFDTFADLHAVLVHAQSQGVGQVLCVSVDMQDWARVREIAQIYPQMVSYSVGLHPTEMGDLSVEALVAAAADPQCIALGETGLDFYHVSGDPADQARQYKHFDMHIAAAQATDLPLIIHTRMARTETLQYLKKAYDAGVRGVLHCFTEDTAMALAAIDYGFYISFSGIVTFKNALQVHEAVRAVPLEWLLVETDAPYLAPEPYRGKSNYPGYVHEVATQVAALKELPYGVVARQSMQNFLQLFSKLTE